MKISPIKLKDSEGYSLSLTIDQIYEVLGIEADKYRVLTDPESKPYGNDPVLYDPDCFRIIDPQEPDFWTCQYGEEGERYCYPPEWNEVGFFEYYHDGISEVREKFWNLLKSYYPETWNERKGTANIYMASIWPRKSRENNTPLESDSCSLFFRSSLTDAIPKQRGRRFGFCFLPWASDNNTRREKRFGTRSAPNIYREWLHCAKTIFDKQLAALGQLQNILGSLNPAKSKGIGLDFYWSIQLWAHSDKGAKRVKAIA